MALEVGAASALWSSFTARAELLGAAVMRTSSEETAIGLLRETAREFACTESIARRFSRIAERGTREFDGPATEVVAAPGKVVKYAAHGYFVLLESWWRAFGAHGRAVRRSSPGCGAAILAPFPWPRPACQPLSERRARAVPRL